MTETKRTWTGFYWMTADWTFGFTRAGGWYCCPATMGYETEAEALEAAKRFGTKVKAELR